MGRARLQRLPAVLIVAAGLVPATASAQAPKAVSAAPPPAKATKVPAAPKAVPAPAVRAEPAPYALAFDSTITLRSDRTAETVTTRRLNILGESALQSIGQQTVAYVEGLQNLDIVEAYTEKADGRRIAVDPASIITRDEASGLSAVYLRDAKARTAIFPDLAVGDTVVMTTRTETKSGVFPGHYVYNMVFARQVPFDVAVYLGVGRVVPNDAATVLKNKYGDCKDQATFMTALLAAKGIASEQVLINGNNAHALDAPATLAALNHVIVYLPELGLYDDPTASFTAFGVLTDTYDKPAVHLSANGVHLARTPAMRPQDHTLTTQTKVTIAANGTVSGETKQSATGMFAAFARVVASAIQGNGPETMAERQLQAFGTPGKGRYEIDSPRNFAEPYVVKGRFTLNERFAAPPAGRKAIPIGMPILSRPGELLLGARYQGRKLPFTCLAGRQVEEIDVTFPEGMPLNNAVQGRKIATKLFSYKSDYRFEGRTLKIRHEFVSLVPGQVCGSEIEADIGRPMAEVRASVNSRLAVSSPAAPPVAKKPPETGLGAFFRSR
jgi:Domain of Unknown Function with PDB structure (DUF3857)